MNDLLGADHHRFAHRLNRLFAAKHGVGKPELTDRHVAAAITEAGTNISASYIWSLRNPASSGKLNPRLHHVEALARYFGVPVGYFSDDDTRIEEELELLVSLRDRGVRALATRAATMQPADLQKLLAMMDILGDKSPSPTQLAPGEGSPNGR